jgi:hypothetical protein
MPNALGVHTVHRLEPALGNGSVNVRKDGSDSSVQADGL